MIDTVDLWKAKNNISKSGTSGYQNLEEFLMSVNTAQMEALSTLIPFYASNNSVQELIAPFVTEESLSSSASGELSKPADYVGLVSISVEGEPAYPITPAARTLTIKNSIREPSSEDGRFYYLLVDGIIQILPEEELDVEMVYIRKPDDADMELTPVSEDDSDYLVPVNVQSLEWPDRAFNLILYMVLEKYGIESKEQILMEYSNLGISREIGKLS